MKSLKSLLWTLLALSSVFPLYRFCHKQTDGFTPRKIRKAFQTQEVAHFSTLISPSEKENIKKILNQPLTYIGRGGQCYAFSTADGQYVVKFLKYNNNYPQIWFKLFPLPFGLGNYQKLQIARKKKKLEGEYKSYEIALKDLPQETGILYMHLDSGDLPGVQLEMFDKIKVHHTLLADPLQFYIQKKGSPFYPELKQLINTGELEAAKKALDEMSSYLIRRSKMNIVDKDNGIWRNFAFYEGKPFQIDIGQFIYENTFSSEKEYQKNLLSFTKEFRLWLETLSPSLANHFTQSISYSEIKSD